jgi:hypothetical protein
MTCPTADMESCEKKCKCVGGPCAGLAYDCNDPCGPGFEFDAATCECISELAESFTVYFTEQRHSTQPCVGLDDDPCDGDGACPTDLVSQSDSVTIYNSTRKFRIDFFQEYQNYADTNPGCPANVRPAGQTWADVFGTDNVSRGSTAGPASLYQSVSYSNSLWAIATDEFGQTWAIFIDSNWSGTIYSTYRAGGYSNISVEAQ